MQIVATLDGTTIARLVSELFPVSVALDDERSDRIMEIGRAEAVDFVADTGLRVSTTGRLTWTLAGVRVPVTLSRIQLMLRPEIGEDERGGKLIFRPELEQLDLKNVPNLIDQPIQTLVNQRLAIEGDRMAWHFGESFGLSVPLPPEITPPHALEVRAPRGAVRVSAQDLTLSIDVDLRFTASS